MPFSLSITGAIFIARLFGVVKNFEDPEIEHTTYEKAP